MNNENEMPRKTISMKKGESDKLDTLAENEHRSVSRQLIHMMDFYVKHKGKVK